MNPSDRALSRELTGSVIDAIKAVRVVGEVIADTNGESRDEAVDGRLKGPLVERIGEGTYRARYTDRRHDLSGA